MEIRVHPHAEERMTERGATKQEVKETVKEGEQFPAKFGRIGFRRNISFNGKWRQNSYKTKQVEVIGIKEKNVFVVIIPSLINHFTHIPEFWLRNFVSRSPYLDMARAPSRFSLKIQKRVFVKALMRDGITVLVKYF